MRVYALTGAIGAGKSTVAAFFREWGAFVIDADAIVRQVQRPGEAVFNAIVARFGDAVVREDGTLDRAALRRRISEDETARRDLEALVHPAVELRRRAMLEEARRRQADIVIAEIPLLLAAGDAASYDGVIVVDAPAAERIRRLASDRGIAADEARRLDAMQISATEQRTRATWIIDNDGDRDHLRRQAAAIWDALRR